MVFTQPLDVVTRSLAGPRLQRETEKVSCELEVAHDGMGFVVHLTHRFDASEAICHNAHVLQSRLRPWTAFVLLAAAAAPATSALVSSLHVAVEHRHSAHDSERSVHGAGALGLALAHGHTHATADPEHDHRATLHHSPVSPGASDCPSPVPEMEPLLPPPASRARLPLATRRAPPGPLFLAHRSLLL